ncbi:hypothetical protein [Levilactobacillus wangkuiensis]|uniref:hypothetical protein n=1 Tax=Levilactobacillus wangkuiensis TaxID=2799566 RepID=UPI0019438098|nr:hypothetical protein [Levilactobacillus wangkuiensis]
MMKWRSLLLAGIVAMGTLGMATQAQAKQKVFNLYQNYGAQKTHKAYSSKKAYPLKKTFTFKNSAYKIRLNNLYVYQVASKKAKYATWAKVTGTAYNNSDDGFYRFGRNVMGGISNYNLVGFENTMTSNFIFSAKNSKSKHMLVNVTPKQGITAGPNSASSYLKPHQKSQFEMLLYSRKKVTKVGKIELSFATLAYEGPKADKVVNGIYDGRQKLNLK